MRRELPCQGQSLGRRLADVEEWRGLVCRSSVDSVAVEGVLVGRTVEWVWKMLRWGDWYWQ